MSIKVKINNPKQIINRIIDNRVKLFAAETWGKHFKKYVPKDSKALSETYTTEPGKVTYTSIYAHFQWEGKVMVDDRGSPWAKKNTKKHYTGKSLKYTYPGASSHWEEVAERKHKSKVAQEITEYIKKR